ncbi:MAG: hypothetical protein ACRKGH_07115 [Dehalogenimonas sp.]
MKQEFFKRGERLPASASGSYFWMRTGNTRQSPRFFIVALPLEMPEEIQTE